MGFNSGFKGLKCRMQIVAGTLLNFYLFTRFTTSKHITIHPQAWVSETMRARSMQSGHNMKASGQLKWQTRQLLEELPAGGGRRRIRVYISIVTSAVVERQSDKICYNKNYQQMRIFILCLYFLFLVFSLHVSGLHGPIIRSISSCCFYATIWFM